MRLLKFRLVNKDGEIVGFEKSMIPEFSFWVYKKHHPEIDLDWKHANRIEHDHKDQFTGLLDKNGKEIYESDYVGLFVQLDVDDFAEAFGYVIWNEKKACFEIEVDKEYKIYFYFEGKMVFEWDELEIIGNKWGKSGITGK